MKIHCPYDDCQQPISIESENAAQEVNCPRCSRPFRCPDISFFPNAGYANQQVAVVPAVQTHAGVAWVIVSRDRTTDDIAIPIFVRIDESIYGPLERRCSASIRVNSGTHTFSAAVSHYYSTGSLSIDVSANTALEIVLGQEVGNLVAKAQEPESVTRDPRSPLPKLSAHDVPDGVNGAFDRTTFPTSEASFLDVVFLLVVVIVGMLAAFFLYVFLASLAKSQLT